MQIRIFRSVRAFLFAFIAILQPLEAPVASAAEKTADVIIIGAGVAGLSTAYRLKKAGLTYTVLESTAHIGGRIRTPSYLSDPKNGESARIGAEAGLEEFWGDNPTLEIFRELKVPLEKSATAFSSFVYEGKVIPFTQDTNQQFLASVLTPAEIIAFRKWDKTVSELSRKLKQRSVGAPLPLELAKLKDVSFADWVKKSGGLSKKAQEFIRIASEPEYGTSWERISALDGIDEWHIFAGEGTPSHHVLGGNQRGAEAIADHIGRENIRLSHAVTNVKSGPEGVVVRATNGADFSQQVFKGKYVVSTVPLFRLFEIQFDPPISEKRMGAIHSQTWGAYFTAHVTVDPEASRFWMPGGNDILPILSDGPLGVIYGGNTSESNEGSEKAPHILNLLVTGDHAERFNARTGSLDQVGEELEKAFEKLWPGFKKHIRQMTFYRYHPRAIASWPLGRSRFDALSDLMREPQGRVYFAGDFTEGTHSDGAAISAIRVVKQITAQIKGK